jgi:tetratricopeptide (TPR) repeat protein
MKKYIYITIMLYLGMQMLSSCDDTFLEEKVYNRYAPSTLTDSLGLEASIVGLHNLFSEFLSFSDRQGWLCCWQVGTDVANPGQPEGVERPYYAYESMNSEDAAALVAWRWAYRMINNANIIIKNVETADIKGMTQNNKNSINAEARFFRAYAYNVLATAFGDVPLVKEPLTGPKTDFVRNPVAELNALIEEDLLFASENLPSIDDVKKASGKALYARSNKAMAQQLLAEAYLRMGQNAKAEDICKVIINSGKFSLIKDRYGVKKSQPGDPYSDMFYYGNQRRVQGNTEAIWVIECENPRDVTGGMTGAPQQRRVWGAAYHGLAGMLPCDSLGGRGLARLRLSNWVAYGLYEANDMRNSRFNIKREFWYNDPANANFGKKVVAAPGDTIFKIIPYTLKWGHFDPLDAFGWGMWKDFPMMRLGETYLLMAEAQVKQGKLADAATSINALRIRAQASQVSSSQMTLDFILDERARELIGEENRRLTLMRTKTLVERTLRLNNSYTIYPITGLKDMHMLLPIPQSEINLNKDAVLTQNPGY